MDVETSNSSPSKTASVPAITCNGTNGVDSNVKELKRKTQNGDGEKVNGVHEEMDVDNDVVNDTNGVEEKEENGDEKIVENDKVENGDTIEAVDEKKDEEDKEGLVENVSENSPAATSCKDEDVEAISSTSGEIKDLDESSADVQEVMEVEEEEEEEEKNKDKDKDSNKMEEDKSMADKDDNNEQSAAKKEDTEVENKVEDSKDKDKDKDEKKEDAKDDKTSEEKGKDKSDNKKEQKEVSDAVDLTDDKAEDTPKRDAAKSRVSSALKPPAATPTMRPMATLLFDLGMDMSRQQVYKDLIRIQQKKQSMDKLDEKETRQLDKLKEAFDDLVAKNDPFSTKTSQCDNCEFKADVNTVLQGHKEYGHVNDSGLIQCSYCEEQFKASQQFVQHMDQVHKLKGRVVVKHSFFVCPFCPFEHNSKASFNKHIIRCERVFNLARNLEPTPADCDIPIKLPKPPAPQPKPKTAATMARDATAAAAAAARKPQNPVGRPPQKPGASQQRQSIINQNTVRMMQNQQRASAPQTAPPGSQMVQVGAQWYHMINVNGQRFLTPVPPGTAVPGGGQAPQTPTNVQHPTPKHQKPSSAGKSPSAQKTPKQARATKDKQGNGTFEICEICGGFVKDRDSLRIHFYWAHKVDVSKEMFNSMNPSLKCDKCNFRCWSIPGLARHKGMAHKDNPKHKEKARQPFYCTLCRPSPELLHTETFWLHMAAKHQIGPDTIFNYPHCVVCGVPNMGVPRALETHMLNIHNHLFSADLLQLARKLTAGKPSAAKPAPKTPPRLAPGPASVKRLREAKLAAAANNTRIQLGCDHCEMVFTTNRELEIHMNYQHSFKCSRCYNRLASREDLTKHFHDKHKVCIHLTFIFLTKPY